MNETIEKYRSTDTWSETICKNFGPEAGISFAIGMGLFESAVDDAVWKMQKSRSPEEVFDGSVLSSVLPAEYRENYNADFLQHMGDAAGEYLKRVRNSEDYEAHTVMEAVILRACMFLAAQDMSGLILDLPQLEYLDKQGEYQDEDGEVYSGDSDYTDWVYDLLGDDCVDEMLPCNDTDIMESAEDTGYAFDRWDDEQW